jgi:hypothetical protein
MGGKKAGTKLQRGKAGASAAKQHSPARSKKRTASAYAPPSAATGLGTSLERQLSLLGLRVKSVTADGNCLFRALSDQLEVRLCCGCCS